MDATDTPKSTRWGQERRLEFIDFRLMWEGKINRGELVAFFSISIQQASLDLARYAETAYANLKYDASEKVYRATTSFKPAFTPGDAQTFLTQLYGVTAGTLSSSRSFIGTPPATDIVRLPTRAVRTDVLLPILWAIRDRAEVELTYQSMRRPAANRRWIAPHAFAFDGSRWHVRAWCYENQDFRDFVLTRVQEVHASRPTTIDSTDDGEWNTFFTLELKPKNGLTEAQRLAVEVDFGMTAGVLAVDTRRALVQYFIRHLQIDIQPSMLTNPHPIQWANAEEFLSTAPRQPLPHNKAIDSNQEVLP